MQNFRLHRRKWSSDVSHLRAPAAKCILGAVPKGIKEPFSDSLSRDALKQDLEETSFWHSQSVTSSQGQISSSRMRSSILLLLIIFWAGVLKFSSKYSLAEKFAETVWHWEERGSPPLMVCKVLELFMQYFLHSKTSKFVSVAVVCQFSAFDKKIDQVHK